MTDGGRIHNYFTNAVHKDCGGLIRVMIQVTGDKRKVGFMGARCRAIWDNPDGIEIVIPTEWVEKEVSK